MNSIRSGHAEEAMGNKKNMFIASVIALDATIFGSRTV